MTDPFVNSTEEQPETLSEEQKITDGRYLYCLVDKSAATASTLSTTGLDDTPVYVLEYQNTGAVVHDCEVLYDTEDLEQVKQWVLTHQQVVDAASEIFGTPLPMRFDTILKGGNTEVNQWLREHHDSIREALTSFAGTWEYRIQLRWTPSEFETRVAKQDNQLQELQQRQQQAGEGERFLLQKNYDNRIQELKRQHRVTLTETLKEAVSPVVNELTDQTSQSNFQASSSSSAQDHVARLAVLANKDDESTLGNRLDEIVAEDGIEIRFTGPWPPYTFAPDIG